MGEENQDMIEETQNNPEENQNIPEETGEVQENAAPEEKDVNAQMEDYLRQVSAGVIPKSGNQNPEAARAEQQLALRGQLHSALQQITNTEVALDSSAEGVLLADLRVYDKKKDRFVMLTELSDPPTYLTGDSKISFDLVSKMLMDEHSFFLPKWNESGEMDMDDPIMIGGGFVNGNYYLQVNDTAKANVNTKIQAPLQKPGFFDRFADLFRRLFNRGRDPICEVWDRYEPFRKAEHDRMKIKKSKPLRMAKSIEDEIKAAQADLENIDVSEEEKEKQKKAFKKQVAVEQALGEASENVLSGEGRKVLEDIHKQIKAHTKNLCEQGNPGKDMDKKWGMLPNVRGTADSDVPAYALFGMAIAFSLLGKRQETLNQRQYRSLVTGNYDAIGGRQGPYKDVIEKFEEVMRNSHRNKQYGFAELDEARNWDAADEEADIINDRTSVVEDGLKRMEQELLQSDPASPWSLELGRMLECAEALTIKKEGNYYAQKRLATFYMSPNAKGLCVKQHDVEKGIGHAPESQEYLAAQTAVTELQNAAATGDYEAFAPVNLEMKTRQILEDEKQWYAERDAIDKPFVEFAEAFSYNSVGPFTNKLDNNLMDINNNAKGSLLARQVHLIAAAYSQADQYQLSGDDIRQFITGQPIRGDEDLTNRFKDAVQEVLNCTDKKANQVTYSRGFDKIEAELYEMKDFTSGWSYILCNALEGCSRKARMSPTLYQTLGHVTLRMQDPPVVSKKDAENFLLEELIGKAHSFQTPDSVLTKHKRTDPNEKDYLERYLKGAVHKELASSFLAQLAKVNGADQRLSFLQKQGMTIKALMNTADTYIHENLDKYLVSEEAFKKAGFGGALKDVKNMVLGMKAKAAPTKAAAKQDLQNEVSAANQGRVMS